MLTEEAAKSSQLKFLLCENIERAVKIFMTRAFFKRTEVKAEANFVLLTRRTLQLDEITNECQKQFTPLAGSIPIVGCDYVCSSFTANYRRELELERSGSIKNEQSSVKDEDFYHTVHFDLC